MKKILSAVLALVMVAATFTMLVPNAFAADEEQVEAKVLYEEDFNDLNGKTPEEILAGAGMKDEKAGSSQYLSVQDGRLHYGYGQLSDTQSYLILNNEAAIAPAPNTSYTLEYDLRFVEAGVASGSYQQYQVVSVFATDADDYTANNNNGYVGIVSQMYYNTTGNRHENSAHSMYIKNDGGYSGHANDTPSTAADRLAAMKQALGVAAETELKHIGNRDLSVKVEVSFGAANANTGAFTAVVTTYVKTSGEYVNVSRTKGQPSDRFTDDLRLMVSEGTVVKIDNVKVTAAEGIVYEENFDAIESATPTGILTEIGWKSDNVAASDALPVKVEGGALVLGACEDAQEEFILVENDVAKNGYVIEYDVMADRTIYTDSGVASFHSAPGDFTQKLGRQGWISQLRWNGGVLSGRYANSDGWGGATSDADIGTNNTHLPSHSFGTFATAGLKLAVKAVFDPVAGTVTTYVQNITSTEKVAWTDEHKVSQSNVLTDTDAEKALWTNCIRLIIYQGIEVSIDNIKITSLEKTPNVYGYQVSTANAANIRLLGVIDNDIFTKAEKVGFRVTMTKVNGGESANKDIDCEYVYSSITQWGADTPTQAAEMLYGASHIYALHVNGITEAVTITVTPYYVDEGVTYLGDAATIEYDPAA